MFFFFRGLYLSLQNASRIQVVVPAHSWRWIMLDRLDVNFAIPVILF
jgi:hypothetical protein